MTRVSQWLTWVAGFVVLLVMTFLAAQVLVFVQSGSLHDMIIESNLPLYVSGLSIRQIDTIFLLVVVTVSAMAATYTSARLVLEGKYLTRTAGRKLRNVRWFWLSVLALSVSAFVHTLQI